VLTDKKKGISAFNKDFARYDQVHKQQSYRLAEGETDVFDEDYELKTCDLSRFLYGDTSQKARFAQELGQALEEIGFAVLTGHGTPVSFYRETRDKVLDFFSRSTVEQRRPYLARRQGSVKQGYFPIEETSDIHPDLVEGWVFCRRAFNWDGQQTVADFWPLPDLEPFFRGYVTTHEPLFVPIMQSMLMYLGCDPSLYDKKLTQTNFGLRLNYYPPIDNQADASGAGRILGHEDVDMFTLLAAPEIEGLQALNRTNGKWVRLHAPPGSLIINTGDYMQRISNDRFPSTTHRVSKPRDRDLYGQPRISFPIAVYVWENEILKVLPGLGKPKYPPVSALEFHTNCNRKIYGDDYGHTADSQL